MIKINQIKLEVGHKEEALFQMIIKTLKIQEKDIVSWQIEKQSIDARKKPNIFYIYSVSIQLVDEARIIKSFSKLKNNNIQIYNRTPYSFEVNGNQELSHSPIVIGAGPAGLFCALQLAEYGYNPILLERGGSVEERVQDVETFWETGVLDTESNVQFGEGGAGTFSDGKLNTGVKDPFGRNRKVLETFVSCGAPKEILYDSKPHIGTDILINVVKNMRKRIIEHGGEVRFHSKVTGLLIQDSNIQGVQVNDDYELKSNVVVLAVGHSARDTFEYLYKNQIPMEAKSFAVGLRVEHKQETINLSQYGAGYPTELPPSPYKLTANLSSGRGVYSFCMCPGGYVVNASSEKEQLAINGMSYSKRESDNANSAIVVTVNPSDYQDSSQSKTPIDGMYFQRDLERKAYKLGNGNIPLQLFSDYCDNKETEEVKSIQPMIKGDFFPTNIRQILPKYIADSIEEGMHVFGHKIKRFSHPDVIMSAIESRTSSPIRILRNKEFESDIKGLYPCGEGAGYAGGITSASIDGIKVFEAIGMSYKPTSQM